jgi:basic membrane protein A
MKYSWLHGSTFSASAELQTMLEGWYSTGTQIVFSCGGSMCTSAFAAAAANNGKVIGVDVDQANDSPTVITSAMKGLREGTIYALEKFYDGKWAEISDKSTNLGAKDNAVGLPTEEASWGFKSFSVEEYNALFEKLQKGEITVATDVDGAESKAYSNVTLDWVK